MRGATRVLWAAAYIALGACHGTIDDVSGGRNGTSGTGGGPGTSANGLSDAPIPQRIWRLSPAQFNSETQRLFGAGVPAISIPDSAGEAGLTNIAANAVVDLGNASFFADGARSIATWVNANAAQATHCSDYGQSSCVDSFLAWFPASAFRRKVDSTEISALRKLFDDLRASYPYDYAFSGVIRAVLLSPTFLYRSELADGRSPQLTPDEIANLLAFSITDKGPDAELLAAAKTADLTKPDVREAQARRLMAASEEVWQRFFWEWLQMATLSSQGNEVGLDPKLVTQMENEYRAFVKEVVVTQHGSLRDVLSASYSYMEPELASFYGVSHPGTGLSRVELDPAQRGGLLTQGAWLVSHGKRGKDNVVRRGMSIFKQAMCHNALTPPAGLDVQAAQTKLVGANPTVRDTVNARGQTQPCMTCHSLADPIGIVFENFTSDARWQTTYPDGRSIDTKGDVTGVGSFANGHALASALVDDDMFQRCFVQRFMHFMLGIDLGATDKVAWTQQVHDRLLATNTSLEEMLVSIVRHPGFIERPQGKSP